MSQAQAQGTFQQIAIDARARFKTELVRASDGKVVTTGASATSSRPEEGPGTVLVTVIVAARTELHDVQREQDATQVQTLLDQLAMVSSDQLVALEVVWSPADESDRMSTAELEARYPEVTRLDEVTVGGRVFCSYCQGPFADELEACPHCGAPHRPGLAEG